MIYNVSDKMPLGKNIGSSFQRVFVCFVATALIAFLDGAPLSGSLVSVGLATLAYEIITKFKSPMILSNSGAFVAPVLLAVSLGGFAAVAIGGAVSALVYCIFGVIFMKVPVDSIYKFMPKVLIGSITVTIGVNLMPFILGYIGESGNIGFVIAMITVLTIALISHYCKGTLSMFPFLIGIFVGYVVSIPFGLVDFSQFNDIHFIALPTFVFSQWEAVDKSIIPNIVVVYLAYTVSAICECLSDHAALSGIIGIDLYKRPGLSRIFIGEGVGNLFTSMLGGCGCCSYGESVAVIGFSKCASIYPSIGACIIMIALGFIEPVQVFINSIPNCVLGAGCACVLYGFISASGIKLLKNVDLDNQKNLLICSVVMAVGISGISIGTDTFSLSGTALALIVGVILNLILKDEKKISKKA